jgi:hypothetical protein
MPRHDPNGGLDYESLEDQASDDAELLERRSGGPTQSEAARRARGHGTRLQLRVTPETVAQLKALCAATGDPDIPGSQMTQSEFAMALIDSEHTRMLRRGQRKKRS